CFDFVQVNEDEMGMMAPDPMGLAAIAFANGVNTLAITLGSRGVVYFAAPGFDRISDMRRASLSAAQGAIRTARVPAKPARHGPGDPTGCGRGWGATYLSRRAAGAQLAAAIDRAASAA